jgi:hypothetical protein
MWKANLNAHMERGRVASLETLECTFAKQSADTSYNRRIYKIELIWYKQLWDFLTLLIAHLALSDAWEKSGKILRRLQVFSETPKCQVS